MTNGELNLWQWHVSEYGEGVDVPATYRKLLEEVGELGEALIQNDPDAIHEEMADVGALCFILAKGLGFDGLSSGLLPCAYNKLETARWKAKHRAKMEKK